MRRREVVAGLAGLTAGWPRAVSAEQPAMPVVGFLSSELPALFASFLGAFTHGLNETGFVEGQNVAIEYRWAQGAMLLFVGLLVLAFAGTLVWLRLRGPS